MATTIGRFITIATAAPQLLAKADKAGPSLRRLAALGVEIADLLKDPAMKDLVETVQKLITALDLGGDISAAEVVTPKEAIQRIASGDLTPAQQSQFDRATQEFGAG